MTTFQTTMSTIHVPLSENNVARLFALRRDGETLDAVVARCVDLARRSTPVAPTQVVAASSISPAMGAAVSTWPTATCGGWTATVVGEPVSADTLGKLLRDIVDAIHDLDPTAIERLSQMTARTRRYVAHKRESVHGGRRDLRVLQARSGWWVSANIGRRDLVRSLRAICKASDLRYGHDIRFPACPDSVP